MIDLNTRNIQEAFAQHTGNEIPPKHVYFVTNYGDVKCVPLNDVKTLPMTWEYMGQTTDIGSFKTTFERAGSLPVLKLKD